MNKSQVARLTALRRMQGFLDENATAEGAVNESRSRADLNTAVTALANLMAQQAQAESEMTGRTKQKHATREELRLHFMQPVAAIAQKKLGKTPALQDLRLPSKNVSDERLVAEGRAMATAAAKYPKIFLDQKLPPDILAQLELAVRAVQQAVREGSAAALRVNEATKGVKAQLTLAKDDVRVLHSLVVRELSDNPGLFGAWSNAKRVHAKGGVPTGSSREANSRPTLPVSPAPSLVPADPAPTSVPSAATGLPIQRAA